MADIFPSAARLGRGLDATVLPRRTRFAACELTVAYFTLAAALVVTVIAMTSSTRLVLAMATDACTTTLERQGWVVLSPWRRKTWLLA